MEGEGEQRSNMIKLAGGEERKEQKFGRKESIREGEEKGGGEEEKGQVKKRGIFFFGGGVGGRGGRKARKDM